MPCENEHNDQPLDDELPDVGAEVKAALAKLRPGDTPTYRRRHPLDRGPLETDEILVDENGEPWSNP